MIFIERAMCPSTLQDCGPDGDLYNKREVVEALWQMQHGKCCYCERSLPKKGHLKAVEHFAPKSKFKNLRNEWTNLLLACSQCNGKKSDKFPVIISPKDQENRYRVVHVTEEHPERVAVIDPSKVDPEEHIEYEFDLRLLKIGTIRERNKSELGKGTIDLVGLDNAYYTDARWKYYSLVIREFHIKLLMIHKSPNRLGFDAAKSTFEELMAPHNEFAGFTRAYARVMGLERDPINLDIPGGD